MPPRHLINENGTPFETAELRDVRAQLDSLPQNSREQPGQSYSEYDQHEFIGVRLSGY